ncbi:MULTISPECIES: S41 family peptidase [unclassified Brevundimonas]|uniref:S41 family peptidase n=1 Tax=unclassified Brevundimonas TaxID=2622653 RepID=UPI0025B8B6B0|nr:MULTISPECIES: S41 family peptidase [unclassified Brevundimonas]
MQRHLVAGHALLMAASAAQAQEAPSEADAPRSMDLPRDWSTTLIQDATGLHDIMVDSHPGTHDPLNPAFRPRLDQGLTVALERARSTTDAGGWWWALRAYVASFEDGHVGINITQPNYGFSTRWPGFLTIYRGADQVVADRDPADASTPPLGARLLDCDGVGAEALAEQRVGQFRGRWFLEAQRVLYGDWQFLSAHNPWIDEMRQCRFDVDGATRTYVLDWRATPEDIYARRARLTQTASSDFGLRHFDDGGMWISTPSFNGDPSGEVHARLTALIADMKTKQGALRLAPYVVLDLRGNGGGSSHWSELMAQILWGDDWMIAHVEPTATAVEWRASDGNIAQISDFLGQLRASNGSPEYIAWAENAVNGMKAAQAAGQVYWRSANEEAPADAAPPPAAPQLMAGRVYVLTDSRCGSACLDAVDLWKAAGALQVGRETSADTVYMDTRNPILPSGLAQIALPMKVYRGRARGSNEPQRPFYVIEGDMSDDAALLASIRRLQPD